MPGTFSQKYVQVVFAVQNRECLIYSAWEEELYKYISGIPFALSKMEIKEFEKDQRYFELVEKAASKFRDA